MSLSLWGEHSRHQHTKQVALVGKETLIFFFSPAGTERKRSLFLRFLQIGDINKSHSSERGNACVEVQTKTPRT